MTQRHDPGTLWAVQDRTAPVADRAPAGANQDLSAVVADLAVQVAEITQRLDVVVSSTTTIRADVESVGAGLVAVCGAQQPTPAADRTAEDPAVQAVRIAMSWIERSHHHPLRAALVILEGWEAQLRETVDRGYLLSTSAVEEVEADDECPTGRWLRSGQADKTNPVRAAALRAAHLEHHRAAAAVLAAVRDGRTDEARRLLDSEDDYTGTARRLGAVLRSWTDELGQRRAQDVA